MNKKDIALMINGFTIGILLNHSDFTLFKKIIIWLILGISIVTYGNLKPK